jgi:hypothetical protein
VWVAVLLVPIALVVVAALALPLRERCWDPRAARSTRVAISRTSDGCVLHLSSGDVTISAAECGELQCEPGWLPAWLGGGSRRK